MIIMITAFNLPVLSGSVNDDITCTMITSSKDQLMLNNDWQVLHSPFQDECSNRVTLGKSLVLMLQLS